MRSRVAQYTAIVSDSPGLAGEYGAATGWLHHMVPGGLPIYIAAKLLGHKNTNTNTTPHCVVVMVARRRVQRRFPRMRDRRGLEAADGSR